MNRRQLILTLIVLTVLSTNALADPYASVRSTWVTCSSCHGASGQGGIGPKLIGSSANHLAKELRIYKSQGVVGPESQLMWGMAGMLSDSQIVLMSKFIEEGFPASSN
tara:strand:- start:687 stop:1010 length:324 start_codon:yes stop_codon:yes gene_type:complete